MFYAVETLASQMSEADIEPETQMYVYYGQSLKKLNGKQFFQKTNH